MSLFEELPPHFAPGARYSYSNSGYCLLGMIIERLSGMPYAEFIRERIFAPLGMTRSRYLTHEAIIPQRAEGYAPGAGGYERARAMSTSLQYAAGALGSTAEDLARWDMALREGRLLDATTYAEATTPTVLTDGRMVGYGLGWASRAIVGGARSTMLEACRATAPSTGASQMTTSRSSSSRTWANSTRAVWRRPSRTCCSICPPHGARPSF